MGKSEVFERGPKSNLCYARYRELGGIINEADYNEAMARRVMLGRNLYAILLGRPHIALHYVYGGRNYLPKLVGCLVLQAEGMARVSGFSLDNDTLPGGELDEITILYVILRTDKKKPEQQYHHEGMCDQRLFAEALRMLDKPEELEKVMGAHPAIVFV